jgi:hypothetical protein
LSFEVPGVKSRELVYKKKSQEGPQFLHLLWAFCQDLEFQVALTGRKKAIWIKKRLPITFLMQIITLNNIKFNSKVRSAKIGLKSPI